MKKGRLEQKLIEKFKDYETNIDLDEAWNNLESRRPRPRRRRIILIFLFGITLIGIGFSFFFVGSEEVTPNAQEVPLKPYAEIKDPMSISSQEECMEKRQFLAAATRNQFGKQEVSSDIPLKQETALNDLNQKINKLPQANDNNVGLPYFQMGSDKLSSFNQLKRSLFYLPTVTDSEPSYFMKPPSVLLKRKSNNWWIGFSAGYGKSFKTLEAINPAQIDLVQARNLSVQPLDAFYLDIFIEKKIGSYFYLKSGLTYGRKTDRLNDQYTRSFTEIWSDQLVEIIRKPDGTEELIYDDAEVSVEEATTTERYLRTQILSIPVMGGIEFPIRDKLNFRISGGMAYSLIINQQGQTIATVEPPGNYIDLSALPYKKSGLWQALAALELNYKLNVNTVIFLGMHGNMDINSLQQSASGISEKYQYLGGQFGIKKMLY